MRGRAAPPHPGIYRVSPGSRDLLLYATSPFQHEDEDVTQILSVTAII